MSISSKYANYSFSALSFIYLLVSINLSNSSNLALSSENGTRACFAYSLSILFVRFLWDEFAWI